MKRITPGLAVAAVATIGLLPAGAAASGPAAPGKKIVKLECEVLGEVTVSIPRPEGSNGAGQIVGQKGHGIVVSSTSVVLDLSAEKVLEDETRESGGGNAHRNQATIPCTSIFEGTAAEFFANEELPPEVGPLDFIIAGTEAQVIPKP
jgi:hypothetical protein